MHLLQAVVDISVIARSGWATHESPVTPHQYVEADLAMKERARGWPDSTNRTPRPSATGILTP